MADQTLRNPVPVPPDAHAPSTLDRHGFDPGEFEWRPVPRRPRADGWSPEVQQRFIAALAEHGTVCAACREVDMSVASAYRLRNAPGAESFARAWNDVLEAAARRLLDLCFERAITGVDEPVFDRDGVRVGARRRFDHRLAALLLRAYLPERFRHAHRDTRAPGEPLPAPARAPAEAIATLAPVAPAAPQLSAPPERMADLIDGARGRAAVQAAFPHDEREPYRDPPPAFNHPQALARRQTRLERAAARDERDGTAARAERLANEGSPAADAQARGDTAEPDLATWEAERAADPGSWEASPSPHLPRGGQAGAPRNRRQRRAAQARAR